MCPLSYGLGSKFNETHFDYFKEAVDYITVKKGAYCIRESRRWRTAKSHPRLVYDGR